MPSLVWDATPGSPQFIIYVESCNGACSYAPPFTVPFLTRVKMKWRVGHLGHERLSRNACGVRESQYGSGRAHVEYDLMGVKCPEVHCRHLEICGQNTQGNIIKDGQFIWAHRTSWGWELVAEDTFPSWQTGTWEEERRIRHKLKEYTLFHHLFFLCWGLTLKVSSALQHNVTLD